MYIMYTGDVQYTHQWKAYMVFMKKIKSACNKIKNKEKRQNDFIASGGRVLADLEEDYEIEEWIKINLRAPVNMLEDIKPFISKRRRETRTSFILDAIQEKIDRLKEEM